MQDQDDSKLSMCLNLHRKISSPKMCVCCFMNRVHVALSIMLLGMLIEFWNYYNF